MSSAPVQTNAKGANKKGTKRSAPEPTRRQPSRGAASKKTVVDEDDDEEEDDKDFDEAAAEDDEDEDAGEEEEEQDGDDEPESKKKQRAGGRVRPSVADSPRLPKLTLSFTCSQKGGKATAAKSKAPPKKKAKTD